MDKIWYRNPSKSEVNGRCGGDEKTEWIKNASFVITYKEQHNTTRDEYDPWNTSTRVLKRSEHSSEEGKQVYVCNKNTIHRLPSHQ